jgi:flagellar biosynthesis protein FlhB
MADENKTEQPTDKKLHEAHEKGQFARAPEVQAAMGLLAIFCVILFGGRQTAVRVAEIGIAIFGHLHEFQVNSEKVGEWTKIGMLTMLGLTLPVAAVSCFASVAAGALQTRLTLSPKALEPQFSKLNPAAGLQRIFSAEGAFRLLVDSAKLAIVGGLIYGGAQRIFHDPIFYTEVEAHRLGGFIYDTTLLLLFRFGLALGALATVNYLHQKVKVNKDLMMTKQEIKDENRSAEGDPVIRNMRRQMARRFLQKQMLAAVRTADVIITNPTHFAVALKYERGIDKAPVVLAKGENAFAMRIKEIGRTYEVPTIENKPIARMLFKFGKVGEAIPIQLYRAVAEILSFVYRTHRYYFHQLKLRRLTA